MGYGDTKLQREELLNQLIDELDFLLPAVKNVDIVAAYTLSQSILSLQLQLKPTKTSSSAKTDKKLVR